jgi:hypothetical protein
VPADPVPGGKQVRRAQHETDHETRRVCGTGTLSGNCGFPPGTVIRQNPAANTTVSRGSAVNLIGATPPKPHGCAQ